MEEMVTITKAEYESLLDDQRWLSALESAGVDNWCGYSEAKDMLAEWDEEDEDFEDEE